MISNKTVLGVIAARGGSKGLPAKNIAELGGRPVVAWSISAARDSRYLDRTILSSDDPDIIAAARRAGCDVPFRRPKHLATDKSSIYDALFHALGALEESYDYIVLLQATSPLRLAEDIDACISLSHRTGTAVISMACAPKPPQWMYTISSRGRLRPVLGAKAGTARRQEWEPSYVPNGAVYVARVDWLRKSKSFASPETRAYIMPPERSVDIDSWTDLLLARAIIAETPSGRKEKKS